ncbi:MAG: SDR family NAD(P)-dependent oxidoreductase [Rickettsiaceae bacterium]
MKDKVVVVTGSTSGIGFGIASKFAKTGAKLVVHGFASDSEIKKISTDLIALGAEDVFFLGLAFPSLWKLMRCSKI